MDILTIEQWMYISNLFGTLAFTVLKFIFVAFILGWFGLTLYSWYLRCRPQTPPPTTRHQKV